MLSVCLSDEIMVDLYSFSILIMQWTPIIFKTKINHHHHLMERNRP